MDTELIKQDFDLYLEKRVDNFMGNLTEIDMACKGLNNLEIKRIMKLGVARGIYYNNEQLEKLYECYLNIVTIINQKIIYVPTLQDFCDFVGVLRTTFDKWTLSEDEDRRALINSIVSSIGDIQMTASQTGKIQAIPTIFRMKAEHNMVEASNPIIIGTRIEVNLEQIKEKMKLIESGKSIANLYE